MTAQFVDISLTISSGSLSWPGFEPVRIETLVTEGYLSGYKLSEISMLTHTGTHIDAPAHYSDSGPSVDCIPFELFIGKVRVLDLADKIDDVITASDCRRAGGLPERVLFRTRASEVWARGQFPQDYPVLDEQAVEYLFEQGVRVVGTDAPSLDVFTSKSPLVHRWLGVRGMHILEAAYLHDVREGLYELIALPLKLRGADASPVRAILRMLENKPDGENEIR